jgi:hypothetical protein
MADVLDSLKIYPGFYQIVTHDDVKSLYKAITDCKIYIKNVYKNELEMHSNVRVRLLMYIRLTSCVC